MKIFKVHKNRKKSDKNLIERAWDLQHDLEARMKRIGKGKYGRVIKMARNPTPEEYRKTSEITGLGILLVGGLGFAIFYICTQIAPWIAEQLGFI